MYGYFTPILLLQAFCVYHAYRTNAEHRWYWLILFFPLIGSVIYLLQNFNNPRNITALRESVKEAVGSNYRIDRLEKALKFSDSVANKSNLADAYIEHGRYAEGIALYRDCLQGFMADDPALKTKLLNALFLKGDHHSAILVGQTLEREKAFRNAPERTSFAWSLYQVERADEAQRVFEDMDRTFTNYESRLEYCKFLLRTGQRVRAKEKLEILLEEFEQMQDGERRLKRNILREVKQLQESCPDK